MLLRTTLLLICSICCSQSQNLLNSRDIPVRIRDLDYVVIEDYHGDLDSRTLELFDNVKTLTLQNSNFTNFNENFLEPLVNLEKLIISYSHSDKIKRKVTSCCKKLKEIAIYSSSISEHGELAEAIALSPLERMYFFRMNVPTLHSKILTLPHLKILEIEYSNLAGIEDGPLNNATIKSDQKLEVLNLQNNKLNQVPTRHLAYLKNLKELNLKGNLIEKVTTENFPLMPNLEKLNLGHNPIKVIDLKGLKEKLPKLKQVDVSGIDIDLSKNEGIPLVKVQIG